MVFFVLFFFLPVLALLMSTSDLTGQFLIQNVVAQASGECAKVKVKVRVNVHGIFSVSSASSVETVKISEGEEPMETEQTVKEEEVGAWEGKKSHLTKFLYLLCFPPFVGTESDHTSVKNGYCPKKNLSI